MAKSKPGHCELCGRERSVSFHHRIPRTLHSNKWFRKRYTRTEMAEGFYLCADCHGAIHKFIPSEKQIGRDFNTREKLLEHADIASFVEWISTRDIGRVRTRARQD